MTLAFRRLHPHFVAEAGPVDLRRVHELIEHATQPEFVYRHRWRVGDLVIWDNRATMHRARRFDDASYRRELRRVTTLDIESPAAVPSGA
jgi:alpha-ketoglutarate-dependent 2,4-dichlorophenoxyacetate dioxygenase